MSKKHNTIVKGFTLIELIVVITIIGILAMVLVPSMLGLVKKAKVAAAISDARTIVTTVETSLLERFEFNSDSADNIKDAFNKILYLDQNQKESERPREQVGCFTNVSWSKYKNKKLNQSGSQRVDLAIASGLDARFSESWKAGDEANPLGYNNPTGNNCAKYLKDKHTNFGLILVYNQDFNVRMMQLYRKGILVTYIDGDYIANISKNACFIGEETWSKIYTDAGRDATAGSYNINLKKGQLKPDGTIGGWY